MPNKTHRVNTPTFDREPEITLSVRPTLLCVFSLYKKRPSSESDFAPVPKEQIWAVEDYGEGLLFILYYFTSAQPKAARFASISAKIFSATLTGSVFTYITEPKRSLVSSLSHFVTASEPCVGGSTQW